MKTLLEICVPTFERAGHLERLLSQLDLLTRDDEIGKSTLVSVSDNCSTDRTPEILSRWREIRPDWSLRSHEKNIGMMRNFLSLVDASRAEYLWLVGDDDEIHEPRILKEVISILREGSPGLLLIAEPSDADLFAGGQTFASGEEYVRLLARLDPDMLRRHTALPPNIFARQVFSRSFAQANVNTWYAQMYGLMRGLLETGAPVMVILGPGIGPQSTTGYREKSFPRGSRMHKEWRRYFAFLAQEFNVPQLREYAARWKTPLHVRAKGSLSSRWKRTLRFAHKWIAVGTRILNALKP